VRRPLASAAAIFIAGIFAHRALPPRPLTLLIVVTAALAGAALLHYRRPPFASTTAAATPPSWSAALVHALLAPALFLLGAMGAQIQFFFYPTSHIAHFTTDEQRLAQLELRLIQPPRILGAAARGGRELPPRQVAQAAVVRALMTRGWTRSSGVVLVQLSEPLDTLAANQTIRVLGMLQRPAPAMNPGQFDWAGYYRQQRILASVQIAHAANVQILSSPGPTPLQRMRQTARDALARGFTPAQSIDHALLRALVLGDWDPQLRDIQSDFVKTGTSHHLAISGMHIAILGALVYGLCRVLMLAPRLSAWIGLSCVILYGLVALPSPPVVRSVLLCVAFVIGLLSRRSLDGIQLLGLSVLAMLVYHPLDLYNAGFQLSFGTVLGLMLFTRPCLNLLASFRDRDRLIAERIRKPPASTLLMRAVGRVGVEAAVAGLVAWTVSAPLIAWHFNQLNPWGIPASLLLAVPVFLALFCGLLKLLLTLVAPFTAPAMAAIAAVPVGWMRGGAQWLAELPGNDLVLPRPPVVLLLLFYGALMLPLLSRRRPALHRALRWAPALSLPMLMLPVAMAPWTAGSRGELRLAILAVDAGQCAVAELPSGKTVLFDAGSAGIDDPFRLVLEPYLRHRRIGRVDAIFLSHANYDHFSAVPQTLRQYGAGLMYVNNRFADHAVGNAAARSLLDAARAAGCAVIELAAGQRIILDERTTVDVLWPPPASRLDPNNSSLVLRLSYAGRGILLAGDIERAPQGTLAASPQAVGADVLIAPHHGSAESSTADFIRAVNPAAIVCSSGQRLTGRQRQFDDEGRAYPLYRTGRSGALTIRISSAGELSIVPFRPER